MQIKLCNTMNRVKKVKTLLLLISCLTYSLSACNTSNSSDPSSDDSTVLTHTVTFDTRGGSYIAPQQVVHGEKVTKPNDPTKEGHNFRGWTYQGQSWSFIGYVVTEDMTITANWATNTYMLTLRTESNLSGIVLKGQGNYKYGADVEIEAVINVDGYSFVGWYDENNHQLSTSNPYSFKMGLDKTITAKISMNKCSLTIDPDYDTSYGTVEILSGTGMPGETVKVRTTPARGYHCEGISNVYNYVSSTPVTKKTLELHKYPTWDSIYLFQWNEQTIKTNADWPGIKLNTVNDVAVFEFDVEEYPKFILSNNGYGQTYDYEVVDFFGCKGVYPHYEGVNAKANLVGIYEEEASVDIEFIMPPYDLKVSPLMRPNEYSISYYITSDGGAHYHYYVSINYPVNKYTVNDEITLANLQYEIPNFGGWKDENGNTVTTIPKGSTGNKKFYQIVK